MDPADARTWMERGLDLSEYVRPSDEWRQALPLVRWMIAQLPGGGIPYERPDWDDDVVFELLDGFLSSSAGAPFAAVDYRDFLRQLCDSGSGDPRRWSASRISTVLRHSTSYLDVPLEIALDAPDLLRAYVPFAHVDSGIRQDLTMRRSRRSTSWACDIGAGFSTPPTTTTARCHRHGRAIPTGRHRVHDESSQNASQMLAPRLHRAYARRMRTLHLRNVPDEVMKRLERLARAANTSVTAVAIRELDAATRRADMAALMATLPDLAISTETIVGSVDADRS